MNIKVAIAMPCNRQIQPKTVISLLEMITRSDYAFYFVIATEGYTISENRSYCVAQARQNDCTHLLFIDDDMIFPKDTLEKLMKHQKEIIGVVYHSRKFPPEPVVVLENGKVVKEKELTSKELIKCQHIGAGIMLIDLEVFNKIDKPYFNTETHESGFTLMGEDAWFCKRARAKGIDIYCDPTIQILHIGNFNY